ncbi:hypothetical protein A2U01_0076572, partial [Trifolium medium]|nr:hypothetical protein [Trifolium medium]
VLAGLEITISRAHFAKLLGVDDYGKRIVDYKSETYYRQSIKNELYNDEKLAEVEVLIQFHGSIDIFSTF